MIKTRNSYELDLMRKSGRIAALALKKAIESFKLGATELEVDKKVEQEIYKQGGDLSYRTVPGYKYATCITVNEQVVHGIPTNRKMEKGDLVSVDLAVMYKGWHTDCAWSVIIGGSVGSPRSRLDSAKRVAGEAGQKVGKSANQSISGSEEQREKEKFLRVGEEALWSGIKQAVAGNRVGDISSAIQEKVEGAGYHVVRSLVGHGVGRSLHEDPEIPGFGKGNTGPVLKSGMTLAIEVIYTKGSPEVVLEEDGWTFSTADGSWGGLFEMSVIVGKDKAEVLTDWRRA